MESAYDNLRPNNVVTLEPYLVHASGRFPILKKTQELHRWVSHDRPTPMNYLHCTPETTIGLPGGLAPNDTTLNTKPNTNRRERHCSSSRTLSKPIASVFPTSMPLERTILFFFAVALIPQRHVTHNTFHHIKNCNINQHTPSTHQAPNCFGSQTTPKQPFRRP